MPTLVFRGCYLTPEKLENFLIKLFPQEKFGIIAISLPIFEDVK
jgi:hypothetical protein